jgi:hypothetical protein
MYPPFSIPGSFYLFLYFSSLVGFSVLRDNELVLSRELFIVFTGVLIEL